ncbi:DUF551 domain-containing protein [Raoultella ornithinolytica]|uniref:DUF551 domain-containing protein n=2 Tax=Raoultella ornithinolytica TaxID=54291 RepID=UPI0039B4DB9E
MSSKLTITDDKLSALLSEMQRSFTGCKGHGYTGAAEEYADMISALRELQERRKAEQGSEPVAYTDEEELNFVNDMACMWTKGMGINEVPLYRHAQPALSSEPMDEIYAELYRLREEVKGPDGFNTWRDAAIAEKKARVELERQINQSGRDIDYLGAMAAFHSDKWHKMDPITGYMHGWNARRNHAQPAPVVPKIATADDFGGLSIAKAYGWNACRAAMLQAGNSPALSPSREHFISLCNEFWGWSDMDMICADDKGYEPRLEWNGQSFTHPVTRGLWRMYQATPGNSPVIPDGYRLQPISEYEAMCATVNSDEWPQRWIPVSEQMPEVGDIVLTAMGGVVNVGETECSAANCRFFTSVISGRELPATHWMPLPAALQEVKP